MGDKRRRNRRQIRRERRRLKRRVDVLCAVLSAVIAFAFWASKWTPYWYIGTGFFITVFLGFGVDPLVRRAGNFVGAPQPPSPSLRKEWKRLMGLNTGGRYIGRVEQPIFFAALWIPEAWPLLASWLVMKTAFYWQSANFTAFPELPPSPRAARYLVAKRHLGAHHVATALVGTGANIVSALVGVMVGRWLELWHSVFPVGL